MKIGSFVQGGFFAGCVGIDAEQRAIIVAPKALGEKKGRWSGFDLPTKGAGSKTNGLMNTHDMATEYSLLAQWAHELRIEGFDDWHLPSRDELEIMYRSFNPTGLLEHELDCEASRIGDFKLDGVQAFEISWYWTSTQYSDRSAWNRYFLGGEEGYALKSDFNLARAIRTEPMAELAKLA